MSSNPAFVGDAIFVVLADGTLRTFSDSDGRESYRFCSIITTLKSRIIRMIQFHFFHNLIKNQKIRYILRIRVLLLKQEEPRSLG